MTCLLDTHVLLWVLFEEQKLSPVAKQTIRNPDNPVNISAVSFWEISLKYSLGKLDLQGVTPGELPEICEESGYALLDLNAQDASSYNTLVKIDTHRDPFDRMILRQAVSNRLTLLSKDSRFPAYRKAGLKLLW